MDLKRLVAIGALLSCVAGVGVAAGRLAPESAESASLAIAALPSPSSGPSGGSASPAAVATRSPEPSSSPSARPVEPKPTRSRNATKVSRPARRASAPAQPLPGAWHVEKGGATLDVRIDRTVTPTAELVGFTVAADAGSWFVSRIELNYGDRRGDQVAEPFNACDGTHRKAAATLRHAYRQAGPYSFTVRFFAAPRATCQTAEQVELVVTGRIHVTPGATPSNGPSPVTIDHANQLGLAPRGSADFQGSASDQDGWIRELSIDWGDGSPVVRKTFSFDECEESARRWPAAESTLMDGVHEYAEPGTYTLTFRAVSTGCDGHDPQEFSVKVPIDAND